MSVQPAMEWLLEHSEDQDYNDRLPRKPTAPAKSSSAGATGDNNNSAQQTNTQTSNSSIPCATEISAPTAAGATLGTISGTEAGTGTSAGAASGPTESGNTSDLSSANKSEDVELLGPEEVLRIFREFRNRPRKPPSEIVSVSCAITIVTATFLGYSESLGIDRENPPQK